MAKVITLKIIESKSQIERKIKEALRRRFVNGHVLEAASLRSGIKIKNLFRRKMFESITYRELSTSSFLVGELGLERSKEKIDAIIEQWVRSFKLTMLRGRGLGVKGGFRIQMVKANYAEVLRLPEAKQRATSTRKAQSNQTLLHWLDWLLLKGDTQIIKKFDVKFGPGTGRTGLAIMIGGEFRTWSVPPGFTGTKDDNFVTEVLNKMESDIIRIMLSEIARAARRA